MAIDLRRESFRTQVQPPPAPMQQRPEAASAEMTAEQREKLRLFDDFAGKLGQSRETFSEYTRKHKFSFDDLVRLRWPPITLLKWPDGLYIPGDADWHNFWFVPPAPGTHRYTEAWLGGNGDLANHSSAATGDVFAYASAAPTDTSLRSEASIGIAFSPTATLAAYTVTVTPALTGFSRYNVNTNADAGGSLREWGALDIAAYEINWVTETTELVPPMGTTFLFDQMYTNLEGMPVNTHPLNTPVSTNVLLQGGRDYVIGVTALVQIDNYWTMNNGASMQPLPPGSTWTVWCSVQGTIVSVDIEATTVYQK